MKKELCYHVMLWDNIFAQEYPPKLTRTFYPECFVSDLVCHLVAEHTMSGIFFVFDVHLIQL